MRVQTYTILSIWTSALQALTTRRPSFFVSSLVAPVTVWLLGAALAGFGSTVSLAGLCVLGGLSVLGLAASLVSKQWTSRGSSSRPASRIVVLTQQAYFMLAILTLSFYSLVLAEQMLLKAGMRIGPALVIIYALSGIAGAVWAPQSLPRSADDDANAARREGKWLPWVVAVQGGLVSLGVFLGVWAAQGSEAWAYFLVAGLGALTALIMVTLGFVSLYRFVILASHTIPAEAITTSGVRP